MAATRRACTAAVGAARQRAGERGGKPGAALGWAGEVRGAGAGGSLLQAGPALAVGQETRRRPAKEKKIFSNFLISRKFQISVFKYPFEQENDFF